MTLRLRSGTPFIVTIEGRRPGRTAVKVECGKLLTEAEEREADELIQKELFGRRVVSPEGRLVHQEDAGKRKAIVRAFLDGASERN